jgi:hypothetical protein
MRRTLPLLLAVAAAAAACGRFGSPSAPPKGSVVAIDTSDANSIFLPLGDTETRPLRDAIDALERADVSGHVTHMADAIVVVAPDGSELVGRRAIFDLWSRRFATEVKAITFARSSYLGMYVFRPAPPTAPGKYLLLWSTVTATFHSGRSVTFPAHIAVHLDPDGKFDRLHSYHDPGVFASPEQP